MRRELGDQVGIANALNGQGRVALQLNDFAAARRHLVDAWKRFTELAYYDGQADSLAGLAAAALAVREPERAARLLGVIQTVSDDNHAAFEAATSWAIAAAADAARGALGSTRFEAERAKGRGLAPDQADDLVLGQGYLQITGPA